MLLRQSYNAIGQYRYMDWAITTPLLLIKTVLMLRIQPSDIKRPLVLLVAADFFMILTGYIGEQQLGFNNEILTGPKLMWGAVSTLGYLVIPVTLFQFWKRFASQAHPEEREAYRLMALTTVTFWGVYPIGYILTAFDVNTNVIHIAFCLADIINKIGLGTIAYLAAKKSLERRVPDDAAAPAHIVN